MIERHEAVQLVALLSKCTPGDLPQDVFEAVGRVAVYPAVEVIPMRLTQQGVEVLLLRRPANDITWPSLLHTPGTILRPTDEDITFAIERVMEEELSNTTIKHDPKFLRTQLYNHKRGKGLGMEYLLEVTDSADGTFFPVEDLPADIISEQIPSIKYAASVYKDNQRKEIKR